MFPIYWRIRINTLLNIVEIRGEVNVANSEKILLGEAVDIIETGISYKGVPIANAPAETPTKSVAVDFALMFPSSNKLNDFMENFQ